MTSSWASAHVAFEAPAPGSSLAPGSTVELRWRIIIRHNTTGWDVEFFRTPDAAAEPVATGLPLETLSYEWTVPDMTCNECSLRVIQRNVDSDYDARVPIVIAPVSGTGGDSSSGTGGDVGAPGEAGKESVEDTRARSGGACSIGREHDGSPARWLGGLLLVGLLARRRQAPLQC